MDRGARRSIPPGLGGLRTPLINGGSIAWKSTARRVVLEAEFVACDVTLADHERQLVVSRRLLAESIEHGPNRAQYRAKRLIV